MKIELLYCCSLQSVDGRFPGGVNKDRAFEARAGKGGIRKLQDSLPNLVIWVIRNFAKFCKICASYGELYSDHCCIVGFFFLVKFHQRKMQSMRLLLPVMMMQHMTRCFFKCKVCLILLIAST